MGAVEGRLASGASFGYPPGQTCPKLLPRETKRHQKATRSSPSLALPFCKHKELFLALPSSHLKSHNSRILEQSCRKTNQSASQQTWKHGCGWSNRLHFSFWVWPTYHVDCCWGWSGGRGLRGLGGVGGVMFSLTAQISSNLPNQHVNANFLSATLSLDCSSPACGQLIAHFSLFISCFQNTWWTRMMHRSNTFPVLKSIYANSEHFLCPLLCFPLLSSLCSCRAQKDIA